MIAGFFQPLYQVGRHGGLAGSSYRQVANADSGQLGGKRKQQMMVVQHMADEYAEPVQPTQRDINKRFEHPVRLLDGHFRHQSHDARFGAEAAHLENQFLFLRGVIQHLEQVL